MYGTLTLYGRPSQATSTNHMFSTTTRRHDSTGNLHPTTPHTQPLPGITCAWFSLIHFRSPLLAESQLFSLPAGTEMFHFPTFPPYALYIQAQVTVHNHCWVPPFGNPRITARLTAPRGISQPPTSFIGSWCQGIHRVLLHTYNNKDQRCSRPLSSSQTTHTTQPATTTNKQRPGHAASTEKNTHTRVLSKPNSMSTNPPTTPTRPVKTTSTHQDCT